MSARTIAVTNEKGGSGKTTTAVNLGAALAERGRRVLVVDLDPQASATAWLGGAGDGPTIRDVLTRRVSLADAARESSAPGVLLVPSVRDLANVEGELRASSAAAATMHQRFGRALEALPDDVVDVVLVDCPPALGFLTLSALLGCRELVVPVEARSMALQGLSNLATTLAELRDDLGADLTVAGILACRVDARTNLSREVVEALREHPEFGPLTLQTVIRENVRLSEAPLYHLPVTLSAPTSPGAEDYRAAAGELDAVPAGRRAARSSSPAR